MRQKISQTHPKSLEVLKDLEVSQILKVSNRFVESIQKSMTVGAEVSKIVSTALNNSTVFTNKDDESIFNLYVDEEDNCVHFSLVDFDGRLRDVVLTDDNLVMIGGGWAQGLLFEDDEDRTDVKDYITNFKIQAYKAVGIIIRLYSSVSFTPSKSKDAPYDNSKKSESLNDTGYTVVEASKNWNVLDIPKKPFGVRGHFRLQPCGVGRKEIKKVFVKEHIKNKLC